MKKVLPAILYCLFLLMTAKAQNSSYGPASFSIPAGFQKTENDGVILLQSPSSGNGSFCIISIYKMADGTNDPATDFSHAWKELVMERLQVKDKPQGEAGETQNGWSSQTGTASFTLQGAQALAALTTMTGYNKTMSFLVITNDAAFQSSLEKFYESIQMQKPAAQKDKPGAPGTLVSDYVFTAPPGWTKEINPDEIVLKGSDKKSTISLLPFQTSSGDLDKDMSTIFWQVFEGWKDDYWNPDHKISTKGILPGGQAYYKEERGIEKETGEGKKAEAYGIIMLVQLNNNQVAVIAGSYVDVTDQLNESMHTDWVEFFHSLSFKNAGREDNSILAKDILGQWITGSASGLATYTFLPNGQYTDGSAFSTSREYSASKTLETTHSIAGNGSYTLKGNQLLLTRTASKKTEQYLVRVFWKKEFGQWLKKIGLLTHSVVDGSLYELTMVLQEKK